MARYHGRRGLVYMSASGSTVAVAVANLTKWSLDMATDLADVTAFGDPNKRYVQGIPDCKGSLEGWWDDTSDALYDSAGSNDGVIMYLYPSSLVLTKYFYGPAWSNFSIDVGVGDAVSIKGDFAANGAWGQM
jgi:hypothetical protein